MENEDSDQYLFWGYDLSVKAIAEYMKLKGLTPYFGWVSSVAKPKVTIISCEEAFGKRLKNLIILTKPFKDLYEENDLFQVGKIERNDPLLVQVVETLGREANGFAAELKVVEIPDDVVWEITEYDGIETVREVARSWS